MNKIFPGCFVPGFSTFKFPIKLVNYKSVCRSIFVSNSFKMNLEKTGRKKFLFSNLKLISSAFFLEKKKSLAIEKSFTRDNLQAYETKSGIKVVDFQGGNGKKPKWGSFLKVNYVIYIKTDQDIRKIDSTYDRNELFMFQHGSGELNIAFEEAIHPMKTGGKRRISLKVNEDQEIFKSGPISPLTGIRQELKMFLKKGEKIGNIELIYDIELMDIIDKNDK